MIAYNKKMLLVTTNRRPTPSRIRFLRQSVTLTGFSTSTFERGITALTEVQAFFDCHLPANKIDECTIIDKCDHGLTIHLTNLYFTPKRETAAEEGVPFTMDVDPTGRLAALAGDQFVHVEQNVVRYNARNVAKGGAVKCAKSPL